MRAIVFDRFGPPEVLHLEQLPKPEPRDDEVLVKVRATTVTAADWRCRSKTVPRGMGFAAGMFLGFTKPRHPILGTELAGEVESVGKAVTRFKAGDRVFAFPGLSMGCYVEYRCIPQDGPIEPTPAKLGDEEVAALSFGGVTALRFLAKGNIRRGEAVLVNGASGGVGTATVQLAKHFGAEVTGVCSTANVALVQSLGADAVIDYTREDFTRNGKTYDIIVDNAGTAPFSRSKGSQAGRSPASRPGGPGGRPAVPAVPRAGGLRLSSGVPRRARVSCTAGRGLLETSHWSPIGSAGQKILSVASRCLAFDWQSGFACDLSCWVPLRSEKPPASSACGLPRLRPQEKFRCIVARTWPFS